jgi:Tetratricopeptide repeat
LSYWNSTEETLPRLKFLISVSAHLTTRGRLGEATEFAMDTLNILKQSSTFPSDSVDLTIVDTMVEKNFNQGNYRQPESLNEEFLDTSTRLSSFQDRPTLKRMYNFGLILERQGRLREAEKLGLDVLQRSKTALGKRICHP